MSSISRNTLAGLTGSLSMVPEALAFSVVAGVPPVVGLQSAGVLCITASLTGAQPASVFGAAGATAVVVGPLASQMGVEYLYAAVILAGVFQVRCLRTSCVRCLDSKICTILPPAPPEQELGDVHVMPIAQVSATLL
jgi:Sulfate permease family